jgi:hypothetical protein
MDHGTDMFDEHTVEAFSNTIVLRGIMSGESLNCSVFGHEINKGLA